MGDASSPVLIYNRIDVNRRNTRLLLAAFAALLLPFAYGLAQLLPSAYVASQILTPILLHERAVYPEVSGTKIVVLAAIALLGLLSALVFAYAGTPLISSFLLWHVGARRGYRDRDPDLFRTVENLCIGAGLPQPTLYIVESTAPNAFTTGSDPEHASLVINRGLLHLLNERELAAVVAHELSHIGNHDTDFRTMLAAVVEIMGFPLKALTGMAWLLSALNRREDVEPGDEPGKPAALVAFLIVFLFMVNAVAVSLFAADWNLAAMVAVASPIYVLVFAPRCATLLRTTMSQQLDFLADADAALLTRDPEGVALAVAKVSGAAQFTPNAIAATAPLYFVDPFPRAFRPDGAYRSHASTDARIALLARMGDGIPETELRAATAAGEEFRQAPPPVAAESRLIWPQIAGRDAEPGSQLRLNGARTVLYTAANDSSAVLADLDSNVLVTIEKVEPRFIRVCLVEGTVGYIPVSAGLTALEDHPDGNQDAGADGIGGIHYRRTAPVKAREYTVLETPSRLPGTQFRLTDHVTPLYAKPDGWSDAAQQLSLGTVVTFHEAVGGFVRVAANGAVGYISTSTHVARLDAA
jgi:heat shock protein HtpX